MFPHIPPAGVAPAAPPGRTVTQVHHHGRGDRTRMKSALDTFYETGIIEPDIRVNDCSLCYTLLFISREAVICALKELKWWVRSKINVKNNPVNTHPASSLSPVCVFATLTSPHAPQVSGGGETGGGLRIHRCLMSGCRPFWYTACWLSHLGMRESQRQGPSILVPCPLGPEPARQP